MRLPLRGSLEWSGRDAWPFLLLLLAVLVPTGLLLWFMSDAIAQQSAASRQTALEAYRGQLRLLRASADALWQALADRLDRIETRSPDRQFAEVVLREQLDGALLVEADGHVSFPRIESDDRLIAADRQLLAVQRMRPDDPARTPAVERLASLLNDYGVPMPSPQRLFAMGELRRLAPEVHLPTEDALRLSTLLMESSGPPLEPAGFRPTHVRDVWALASANRRIVGLYRTAHLRAQIDQALAQFGPKGIRFITYPPDASGDPEAIAAGPSLPGWQLSFAVLDSARPEAVARGRLLTYLWVGFAGIAMIAMLGVVAGQTFGRQLRLARLKTTLTAAVSHELRAPLASVRVLVDGLLADEAIDPVKTREYLHLIAGEHARLSRVIEHFLTFARLERERERFVLVPTPPSTIVAAAVDAIRDRLSPGCDLRVEIAADLPSVMADGEALGAALVNLLDNALKYTPDDKRILVRAYAEDRSVMFAVRDNGSGIPVREQRRIFRPFYRTDQRLARETAGVGLGLSIVALIVRAHGGRIDISSQPGAGSTFAVRLPAV